MTQLPVWASPEWATAAISFFVAGVLALVWGYWFAPTKGTTRVVAALLKLLGLGLLAMFLVEPLLTGTRPRTGANLFAMAVDDSQSLTIHEPGDDATRGEQLQRTLLSESSWQTRLERDFDLRRFAFDSQLRGVKDFGELKFEGDSTPVGATLAALAKRLRGLPTGGILLFTDGNSTDQLPSDLPWEQLPPIYPVVVGSQRSPRDVSVEQVSTSQTNFDAAPVTIRATVRAIGPGERKVVAHLVDENGKELESRTVELPVGEQTATVRFELRPTEAGVSFYDVRATLAQEDPSADEATLANNTRKLVIDRGAGPYRVLYVCGRPNWDFKFLRRAMEEDDQIELVGLIRISNREPRFTFRRRGDRGANQLFDGFEHEDEETAEQYDEPVLARLGTRDEEELRDGFPKTTDELYQYDAIVLDDLGTDFFSQDQMSLVEKFVSRRGGGFLMLSGASSFAEGEYQRTPIGNLLPVYLDRTGVATPTATQEYRLALTREGWLQPWVRLRQTEAEDRQRLAAMPAFRVLNNVGHLKPGATELAQVIDQTGQEQSALVAQRYGRGRSAALLIGDLWRWGMRQDDPANDDLERAWRQTVRWLVADVPQRVEVDVKPSSHHSSSAMQLAIHASDREFLPLENATVEVEVTGPTGKTSSLRGNAGDAPGDYIAMHVSRTPGAYVATVEVTAPDGSLAGTRETGWVVQPLADEFRQLQPNRDLLEEIASRSGGEVLEPRELTTFVNSLQSREMPLTEPWTRPLWHHPLVFLLAIVCLTGEWGLRRWKGLA